MILAGTISENPPKQHIKKVGKGKNANLHKSKMAAFSHVWGIIYHTDTCFFNHFHDYIVFCMVIFTKMCSNYIGYINKKKTILVYNLIYKRLYKRGVQKQNNSLSISQEYSSDDVVSFSNKKLALKQS